MKLAPNNDRAIAALVLSPSVVFAVFWLLVFPARNVAVSGAFLSLYSFLAVASYGTAIFLLARHRPIRFWRAVLLVLLAVLLIDSTIHIVTRIKDGIDHCQRYEMPHWVGWSQIRVCTPAEEINFQRGVNFYNEASPY